MPIQSKQQPPYYTTYDQPETAIIYKTTKILTDSQIKALPTTPIQLAAAPGDDKMINLINAIITIKPTAGAYTNIHADNVILLQYTGGGECSTYAKLVGNTNTQIWTIQTQLFEDSRAAWLGYYDGLNSALTAVENRPLSIFAYNNNGDFTGGNTANTLTITAYYTILNLF